MTDYPDRPECDFTMPFMRERPCCECFGTGRVVDFRQRSDGSAVDGPENGMPCGCEYSQRRAGSRQETRHEAMADNTSRPMGDPLVAC